MSAPTAGLPGIPTARARAAFAVLGFGVLVALVLMALKDRAPNAFHAHGYCYLWQPSLVGLLVVSDLSIWLSYAAIGITLAWFVYRGRHALPFGWVFLAFGGFIVACGLTHLMDVVTLWVTAFWLAAGIKAMTAVASVATAVALPPLVPKVLALIEAARLSEQRRVELEQAVNMAKAEEARFRTLFDSSPDALLVVAVDGRIQGANSTAERFFGYSRLHLAGRRFETLLARQAGDDGPAVDWERLREQAQMRPVASDGALQARRRDGTRFPVEISASAIAAVGNEPGVLAVVRDITERAKAEEQRAMLEREKDARAEAEAANRAKDELLSVVSHELRTPLNAILGWTVMLRTKSLDEQTRARALEVIERNADVQRRVVDDLLDVSRIVAGKLTLEREPVDVCGVVEAAVDSIRHDADAKGVRLDVACEPAPPVIGDTLRLQQVFWNLLANAVKFTPAGGLVRVSTSVARSGVRVEITDTGIGIQPDFLPHVFDRFRQHDSSSTRAHGGLGLGLALVRYLVEWHEGEIEVSSGGTGKGTTFVVTLPPARAGETVDPKPEAAAAAPPAERIAAEKIAGVKVLMVDDDTDNRELLYEVLTRAGATVTTAASGREALEHLALETPDVLVTDLAMPGVDGYELIERVRRQGCDVSAIALTAHGREQDAQRAIECGFDEHLAKPVLPDAVVEAIANLARRR